MRTFRLGKRWELMVFYRGLGDLDLSIFFSTSTGLYGFSLVLVEFALRDSQHELWRD